VTPLGEILFLSEKSSFQTGKAIRGGIPVIWPQFGPGNIQTHGFARNSLWEVASTKNDNQGVELELKLGDTEETRKIWPHHFAARLKICLSSKLEITFHVLNTGEKEFSFQFALHSYFSVSDIRKVSVSGLNDLDFIDKTKNGVKDKENRQHVTIEKETDRVYLDLKEDPILLDSASGRQLRLEKGGFRDAVVWNPWIEKARALTDLGESAYPKFICIEIGVIGKPEVVQPGGSWSATHSLIPSPSPSSL